MADPLTEKDQLAEALEVAATEARRYLEGIDGARVLDPGAEETIRAWSDPMPEQGDGTLAAVAELLHAASRRRRAPAGRASFTS